MGELIVVVVWVVGIWLFFGVWNYANALRKKEDGVELVKRYEARYGRAPKDDVIWAFMDRTGSRHEERPDLFGESEG